MVIRVSFGEGNGNPLQYSYLENPMDREAWLATVHGVTRVGHNLATKERERERSIFCSNDPTLCEDPG